MLYNHYNHKLNVNLRSSVPPLCTHPISSIHHTSRSTYVTSPVHLTRIIVVNRVPYGRWPCRCVTVVCCAGAGPVVGLRLRFLSLPSSSDEGSALDPGRLGDPSGVTMGVLSIVCELTCAWCNSAHEWFRQHVSSGPHSAVRGWEMPDMPGRGDGAERDADGFFEVLERGDGM